MRPLVAGLLKSVRNTILASSVGVAAIGALVGSNLWTYHRFTHEIDIATISFDQTANQRFTAKLFIEGEPERSYALSGDEWRLDVRMIKWQSWATWLGKDPYFKLDRLSGRFESIEQEKKRPRTVYSLYEEPSVDIWSWLKRNASSAWGMDASYGSSVYLPMKDGESYRISLSHTGLLARPNTEIEQ